MNLGLIGRRLHGCAGLLTAPTLLFFALTGTLQLFGLHEARSGYTPPPVLVAAGMLHKDQVLSRPRRHQASGGAKDGAPGSGGGDRASKGAQPAGDRTAPRPKLATTLLKVFVALAAVSLMASTCVGVWLALQTPRRRALHLGLLAAGVVIPIVLVLALR